ncbi:MAG: type I methionyl aminopeptidase [Lachnospiraceae bacterium]|nr:type I methionyl aminopeptidase [Lachnospiraceae bacterium]
MAVTIKSKLEIDLMRESGHRLAKVFDTMQAALRPGMTTKDIDRIGEKAIRSLGGIPNFLNYNGFPASICVSVNDEVVHGIPDDVRVLREGDIVSLDAGMIFKGWHSDAARTFPVGAVSPEAEQLMRVTRECFFEGIRYAREGCYLHDISNAIADHADRYGYGIVEDLVGHGIGTNLHEDPEVPNFHVKSKGIRLRAGMTLAIEPMINIGTKEVEWLDNDWTVVTMDGSLSAHYENTVVIRDGDPEILTLVSNH